MYLVDSLPAPYCEEREAAEAAKRLAQQQLEAARRTTTSSSTSLSTRPSATVLGNIFQGFVRAAGQSPSPPPGKLNNTSGTNTPVATPPAKVMTHAEVEALMAEKRRDADIVGFRAW